MSSWLPWAKQAESPEVVLGEVLGEDAESPEVVLGEVLGEETESSQESSRLVSQEHRRELTRQRNRFRQQLGIVEQQLKNVQILLQKEKVDCVKRIQQQVQVVMRHYDEENGRLRQQNDHLRQRLITLTAQITEAEQILESLKGFVEGWKVGE